MDEFKVFKTYKERGEWAELRFMAEAMFHGYKVSKPWGSSAFDIGVESGRRILRVQVKSTSNRTGTGYLCQFKPNATKKQDYTLQQIDFFAAYVIPKDRWYIIPAKVILGVRRKHAIMFCPIQPLKKGRYSHEHYLEAWPLMFPREKKIAAKPSPNRRSKETRL
ncbi:MAG TPA: group I intron-associated PD-(D/E)XK endonuclease [Candidatus Sulfotelmatobacter sp.]